MLKRLTLALLSLMTAFLLTACSFGALFNPESSEPSTSADFIENSSQPPSSEEPLGAMDNGTAIDFCLRIYNAIYPIAQMSSADELSAGDIDELTQLIEEVERYGHDTDDQRTLYTIAMAGAAKQALNYGKDGFTDDTLSAAIDAANSAYYAMYMGFRQELRIINESDWKQAANILSQKS